MRQGGVGSPRFWWRFGLPLLVVLRRRPKPFIAWLHRLNRGGPDTASVRGIALLEQFLDGLKSVRRLRELTRIIASSLVMWLMIDLSVWLGLKASTCRSGSSTPFF